MLHVVVVGAGPAGLVAAETLARSGVRVTIIERRPTRHAPCAGIVSTLMLEEFGLGEQLVSQRIGELAIFSPTSRVAFLALIAGDRRAAVVPRDAMQTLLRRRVEGAGVTFMYGHFTRFRHGEGDYPIIEVVSPDGARSEISCDIVIAADGASSRVARALGLAPLELGVAYQERLALPHAHEPGSTLSESMQVHFGRKVSSDAYGYLLPRGDHLIVGVSTQLRFGKRVWDNLSELKRRLGHQLDGAKPAGRESFVFPIATREKLAYDRVLFVGDAAGLVPPASRDGLYFACKSGAMAAQTILRHRNLPLPERLAEYETDFWGTYGALFAGEARMVERFFGNDRRRDALIDLAWDRDLAREAIDASLGKRRFAPGFGLGLRLRTKLFGQLVKRAVANPKRQEPESIAKVLPMSENYLDLALRTPTGPLRLPLEPLGLPPAPEAPPIERWEES